jgi:ornithine decarboxylase
MTLLAPDRIPSTTHRPTPYAELDVAQAVRCYRRLGALLPRTALHYPVRANPHPDLLAALAAAGSNFVVASPGEARACLTAGAGADDLVYADVAAARNDLAAAAELGVRVFMIASPEGVADVALAAPGTAVLCRIVPKGDDTSRPARPGCSAERAVRLLRQAAASGLDPAGVSFHVASEDPQPRAWRSPIAAAARIFDALRTAGHRPWLLDLGGGFPAAFTDGAPPEALYAAAIDRHLHQEFGVGRPRTMATPGRAVVAEAGRLVGTVVSVRHHDGVRRVRVDVDVSRAAGSDEAVRHRLCTSATGPTGPCVLVGPRDDERSAAGRPVLLPLELGEGDRVEYRSVGAFTTCHTGARASATELVQLRLVGS